MPTTVLGPFSGGERAELGTPALVPQDSLWRARNVEFYRGALQKRPGRFSPFKGGIDGAPLLLYEYRKASGDSWLVAVTEDQYGHAKVYTADAQSHAWTDRSPQSSSSVLCRPSAVTWENQVWVTWGGSEGIFAWDGAAERFTAQSGSPQCRYLGVLANHLVAAYIIDAGNALPQTVKWSSEPGLIGPGEDLWLDGDSGENILVDPPGHITDLWRLGDYLYVARQHSITRMSFVGPPYVFAFQAIDAPGCVGPHSLGDVWTEEQPTAFYLGEDNVYAFNGIVARPAPDAVRRVVTGTVNRQRLDWVCGMSWPARQQYWLSFASTQSADNDLMLVVDYGNGAMYLWELPATVLGRWQAIGVRTIDDLTALLAAISPDYNEIDELPHLAPTIDGLSGVVAAEPVVPLIGTSDGTVWQLSPETTIDGTVEVGDQQVPVPIRASVETGLVAFDPLRAQQIRRVGILAERPTAGAEVTVQIGASEDGHNVTWQEGRQVALSATETPWLDARVSGRAFAFRLTNDATTTFRVSALVVDWRVRGR